MKEKAWLLLLCGAIFLAPGCSRRISGPGIDPASATAAAMAEYDQNRDGFLDAKELERCPALLSRLPKLDKDKDGRLSQAGLVAALASLLEGNPGLLAVRCSVHLDDKPLADAEVVLEPESFLGAKVKTARGTTDRKGVAQMKIEGPPATGCHVGLYRVRISKRGADGKETLPERYNAKTQLGAFVTPMERGIYSFSLSSR